MYYFKLLISIKATCELIRYKAFQGTDRCERNKKLLNLKAKLYIYK